jgi:UDP-glucose 4-epimerase
MSRGPIAVVTGGAGFIGSHMVDLLVKSGYQVRVIDDLCGGREANIAHHADGGQVDFAEADIRSITPQDALFRDASYVFHFAGIGDIVPSIESPAEYMDVNVQGTVRVLEAARHNNVKKLIYAASSSCYGLADTPTDEQHVIRPQYPYALSKYMGEQSALHWHRVYGLPVNAIRIFNAYGTRSRTSGAYGAVFGVFLRQKLAGEPLTVVGDGAQTRDFLYVTDVAKAFLAAAETKMVGEIWNLGAGKPQSVLRLVELMECETVAIPKRPGEPDCTFANIDKIQRELNWKPSISFETGVAEILMNIDYWANAPLWDEAKIAQATKTWFKYLGPDGQEGSAAL